MRGVERGIGLFIGFPMRSRRYRGGSSQDRAGLGMSSDEIKNHFSDVYGETLLLKE